MIKSEIFKRIKRALVSEAPPHQRSAKIHLQMIKYADKLVDAAGKKATGKEFCEGAGLPEVWGVEFNKMRNLVPYLKAAGLDVSRLGALDDNGKLHGVEQKAVFSAGADKHFSSIDVASYRGLSGLRVEKLSNINIFAGVNNSGKTSLLEAIYLLCKQNDFNGIVDVVRYRGKISEDRIASKWFADQLTDTISVGGVFDGKPSRVEIKPFDEENSGIDRSNYLKSVAISTQFGEHKLKSLNRIYQGSDRETQADTIKLLANVVYSSPFFLNEPQHYTAFYRRSVQSKLLPKVIRFIRDKIVPTIRDVRLVDEFQRFLVDDASFENAMDLASYGEGQQRIFFISLLFASAQNGVLLIDEFENAIHADLVEEFSKFIHTLAAEFNVQVFLTSHSKECIDSFVENIPESSIDDFAFHALVRSDEGVAVREFDGNEFYKLVDAGDVDLRRAR